MLVVLAAWSAVEEDWCKVTDALSSTIVYDASDFILVHHTLQRLARLLIQCGLDWEHQESFISNKRDDYISTMQAAASAIGELLIDGKLLDQALASIHAPHANSALVVGLLDTSCMIYLVVKACGAYAREKEIAASARCLGLGVVPAWPNTTYINAIGIMRAYAWGNEQTQEKRNLMKRLDCNCVLINHVLKGSHTWAVKVKAMQAIIALSDENEDLFYAGYAQWIVGHGCFEVVTSLLQECNAAAKDSASDTWTEQQQAIPEIISMLVFLLNNWDTYEYSADAQRRDRWKLWPTWLQQLAAHRFGHQEEPLALQTALLVTLALLLHINEHARVIAIVSGVIAPIQAVLQAGRFDPKSTSVFQELQELLHLPDDAEEAYHQLRLYKNSIDNILDESECAESAALSMPLVWGNPLGYVHSSTSRYNIKKVAAVMACCLKSSVIAVKGLLQVRDPDARGILLRSGLAEDLELLIKQGLGASELLSEDNVTEIMRLIGRAKAEAAALHSRGSD
eukprot:jgi/Chrzof1/4539/Cz14g17150.t1